MCRSTGGVVAGATPLLFAILLAKWY